MTKRLKDPVVITRPFAIFFEPDGDVWVAKIVGHELDNCTQGVTPADSVEMAADLVRVLTGGCRAFDVAPHAWRRAADESFICARCGEIAAADALEDIP